ncbi:MAG: hypothetical protein WC412_08020 [Candidatus Omnitrophota bacterium]
MNSVSKKPNIEDMVLLTKRLETTIPFNEFSNAIATWQIELSTEEVSMFFKHRDDFPYLSVRQDFLDSLRARIKQPFKLVIIDNAGSVACAEISSINQISLIILNKKQYSQKEIFSKVFLHELGHALGLRDEGERSYFCEPGPPNCAATKKEAISWWGDLVGKNYEVSYFGGCCGSRKNIRPTSNSLMKDYKKSDNYGVVNERYLRGILSRYCDKN